MYPRSTILVVALILIKGVEYTSSQPWAGGRGGQRGYYLSESTYTNIGGT